MVYLKLGQNLYKFKRGGKCYERLLRRGVLDFVEKGFYGALKCCDRRFRGFCATCPENGFKMVHFVDVVSSGDELTNWTGKRWICAVRGKR